MAAGDEERDPYEWEVRDGSTSFAQHAAAGSCAGVMEHLGMYPLDTVKTRMQASSTSLGVSGAVREVLRERGLAGFMRGAHVIGLGCIPAHVGLFGMYELARTRLMVTNSQEHQPLRTAACGGAGALVHDALLTPHDVVKQRLQLGRHVGAVDCIASTWRAEGFRAFYRSLPATLAMNVPFTATLVAVNESLKLAMQVRQYDVDATLSEASGYFLCAGLSGAVAAAVTSPLDVVRTRLQTQEAPSTAARGYLAARPGIADTLRAIIRTEGARGLVRGMLPRIFLAAPSSAISWGTYETVRMGLRELADGPSRAALRKADGVAPARVSEDLAVACACLVQPAV